MQQIAALPERQDHYEDQVISLALKILEGRAKKSDPISSPNAIKEYLTVRLSQVQHEVFGMIYMDIENRIIDMGEIFRGTVNHSGIYPREVIKECLARNATAVILYHNHPGGLIKPSQNDIETTALLIDALKMVDVVVHDHIIVAGAQTFSFHQNGKMPTPR